MSNAMRFMNKFAASPASTWRYLEQRLQPYLKKLRSRRTGWAQKLEDHMAYLCSVIRDNEWESDEKLSAGWLHEYYTDEMNQ